MLFISEVNSERTRTLGGQHISRIDYKIAVRQLGIMDTLSAYDPHIAGTPPLGVDVETSDIDILCFALDAEAFVSDVSAHFAQMSGFRIWQWTAKDRPVIATFRAYEWEFELFANPTPVSTQLGWRHFEIERRLLSLGGDHFKSSVQTLRRQGLKTEPAFWLALLQEGDAYSGLLTLEEATDEDLLVKLAAAGFNQNSFSTKR